MKRQLKHLYSLHLVETPDNMTKELKEHYSNIMHSIHTRAISKFTPTAIIIPKDCIINFNNKAAHIWAPQYPKPSTKDHNLHDITWAILLNQPITQLYIKTAKIYSLDETLPNMQSTIKNIIISLAYKGIHTTITQPGIPSMTFGFRYSYETYNTYETRTGQYGINLIYGIDPPALFYKELNLYNKTVQTTKRLQSLETYSWPKYKLPRPDGTFSKETLTEVNLQHIHRWAQPNEIKLDNLTVQTAQTYVNAHRNINYYLEHELPVMEPYYFCECGYPIKPAMEEKQSFITVPDGSDDDPQVIPGFNLITKPEQITICPCCFSEYKFSDFYPDDDPDTDDYLDYNPKPTWHKPRTYSYKARLVAGNFIME